MHYHLLLLLMAATALLLLLPTAPSLSASDFLSTCNRTFSCGRLVNISYPFTGLRTVARQSSASAATATTPSSLPDSLAYKVWALDQTRRSLALSRADLFNTTACLQQYANTTLNSTIFTLASDREGLTLFYECSKSTNINPDNQFSCEINGTETDDYYLIGAVPTDPILNGSKCEVSVTVPIQPFAAYMLTADESRLIEVLLLGFQANYTNPYKVQCVTCGGIGGECGFDSDRGKPICICG